ncbi:MAG: rhodanese-like domain-containing protein [Planctomycetota bacterium]
MRAALMALAEAVLLGAAGLGLGLLANKLSPQGLNLERDYFPRAEHADATGTALGTGPAPTPAVQPEVASDAPAQDPVLAAALARLSAKGLQALLFDEVLALHQDPLREAGAYLFLDARTAETYAEGHLPGALLFDRYRIDRDLPAVLAASAGTLRIVIYCHGGECEDSEFAALMLRDFLSDPSVLAIYAGGYAEWTARGQAVER